MKIKRFNNLWTMGLILSAAIFVSIYFVKIVFPEFAIQVAEIKSITNIGHYIDNNKWAWYLVSVGLSFFVYYFYCCACCKKKSLNKRELVIVIITIIVVYIVKEFLPSQYTTVNISSMILLPYLMKGDFTATTVCFVALNFVQTLTLEIRGLSLLISDFNYATLLILMIDAYIVIWLLYNLFNFKKGDV